MELDTAIVSLTIPPYDDDDNFTDVATTTSAGGDVSAGGGGNVSVRQLCSVGEDVTQRISVVSVIMICTIVGNLTLILTLTLRRSRRIKRVNVFLVNLAIGDLAVAVFTNTTEIIFLAFGDWALGNAGCKISVYMQIVTLASATFLLTAMSMDRYQVIVKPMQSLARRPRIGMKVGVAWVMAFIFATPQLFIFLQMTDPVDGRRCCVSKGYTHEWQRKAYMSFMTAYILLIPTVVMIYCYAKIIHVVWIRARNDEPRLDFPRLPGKVIKDDDMPGSPRMSVRRGLVTSSKRRVVTMTLTVIVGFLVCQTPYFLVSLVRIYSNYQIKLPNFLAVAEMIVLMHSALNPVLYGLFTLRKPHFEAILDCLGCRQPPAAPGERHLLLNGKWLGRTLKSSGLQRTDRSADHAFRDDIASHHDSHVCKNSTVCSEGTVCKNSAVCKDDAVCRNSIVCSEGVVCKNRTVCISADRKLRLKPREREKEEPWAEHGTGVPLLLITNTAAVTASNLEADTPLSAKDETSSGNWGRGAGQPNPNNRSPKIDRPSVACSQWTPSNTASSECYSCV